MAMDGADRARVFVAKQREYGNGIEWCYRCGGRGRARVFIANIVVLTLWWCCGSGGHGSEEGGGKGRFWKRRKPKKKAEESLKQRKGNGIRTRMGDPNPDPGTNA
ncbi:hypothetical protein L2E82_50590 [Cichorium intybus]|nr:hypothetical protein L2E82_50590 [Cichorium intybus]